MLDIHQPDEQLPWIEYAHNSLTSPATGVSPFEASLGYQPPPFPAVEGEHFVPSFQQHFQRFWRARRATQAALLCTAERLADCHWTPAPPYTPRQKVWLSARFILLRSDSKKLSPTFICPLEIDTLINPVSVHLRLPRNTRIPNVFHVSQV